MAIDDGAEFIHIGRYQSLGDVDAEIVILPFYGIEGEEEIFFQLLHFVVCEMEDRMFFSAGEERHEAVQTDVHLLQKVG